jgi:hypothetical protein
MIFEGMERWLSDLRHPLHQKCARTQITPKHYATYRSKLHSVQITAEAAVMNDLCDLSKPTFRLFPKSIQVVDSHRLVRSILFEAAPKLRKIRFE